MRALLASALFTSDLKAQIVTEVISDATWRTIGSTPAAGWNTSLAFDDSNAAGWQNAFQSPTDDHIWITSNLSSQAPDQAWFRHVFTLNAPVISASADFFFDDNGEGYINGQQVIVNGPSGGARTVVPVDPSLFVVGSNFVAIHGIDTIGPFNNVGLTMTITLVPEPGTVGMAAMGGLFLLRRRTVTARASAPHA